MTTSDVSMGETKTKTPERIEFDAKVKAYDEACTQYEEGAVTFEDVGAVLGETIKGEGDKLNAEIIFACLLLNYTEASQQNVLMKADSSTGKTYLIKEAAALFPEEDRIELFNCSPTAFIYEWGAYDHETNTIEIDLHQRIIILYDQKSMGLLEELRPLLSHDKKVLTTKRTDKSKKHGHSTKTIRLIGYPTFMVCNASLKVMDEQELTRTMQISPEVTQDKLKASLHVLSDKLCDGLAYREKVEQSNSRIALTRRVAEIKERQVSDIEIPEDLKIEIHDGFLETHGWLTPRNMRDYPRLIALIKASALLNAAHRSTKQVGTEKIVTANQTDLNEGLRLYTHIAQANELGLSPEVYDLWINLLQPNIKEDEEFTRAAFRKIYFGYYHRNIGDKKTRNVLETLVAVGLLEEDTSQFNKHIKIYKQPFRAKEEQSRLDKAPMG